MKRAFSAEKSLATTRLSPSIQKALRAGQKMDLATTGQTGCPAPEFAAAAVAAAERIGNQDQPAGPPRVSCV